MSFDRGQHVDEAAQYVRPDRFALVGAGHRQDLVGRNAEMIRPKPNEPLDEADFGGDGRFDADFALVLHELHWQCWWRVLLSLSRLRHGGLRIRAWVRRVGGGRTHALPPRRLFWGLRPLFVF